MKSVDITPLFECKSLTKFEVDRIELTTTVDFPIEDWPEGIRKHRKKIRKISSFTQSSECGFGYQQLRRNVRLLPREMINLERNCN